MDSWIKLKPDTGSKIVLCKNCRRAFERLPYRRPRLCWECEMTREKKKYKRQPKTPQANLRTKAGYLMREYGLTIEDFENMKKSQEGKCKICKSPEPGLNNTFNVDHCHATGKVRALLCNSCNWLLGNAKDIPSVLREAADYLEHFFAKHKETS